MNEIIKSLFVENNDAIVSNRLPTVEESAIELDKIKTYEDI
jgi:hypothetical protein